MYIAKQRAWTRWSCAWLSGASPSSSLVSSPLPSVVASGPNASRYPHHIFGWTCISTKWFAGPVDQKIFEIPRDVRRPYGIEVKHPGTTKEVTFWTTGVMESIGTEKQLQTVIIETVHLLE